MLFSCRGKPNPITPKKDSNNPAEHYVWCLKTVFTALEANDTHANKIKVLKEFRHNMQQQSVTASMMNSVQGTLSTWITSANLPSDSDLKQFLTGIAIPEQGYIAPCKLTHRPK